MKKCVLCGRELPETEFGGWEWRKHNPICHSCERSEYDDSRYDNYDEEEPSHDVD